MDPQALTLLEDSLAPLKVWNVLEGVAFGGAIDKELCGMEKECGPSWREVAVTDKRLTLGDFHRNLGGSWTIG